MKDLIGRRKKLKEKLKNCDKIFTAWTSLAHPSITEMFCKAPFDCVGIDVEHSTISQESSQRIIAVAQASGSLCLPRIASHNPEMARRLLDSGADGLIVPMVNTVEDVENIIKWMKYPPIGKRGFGVSRAQGYGMDFDEYIKSWNKSSSLIVQIETIEAVDNIDEIIAFPEVDGVMVGPYDISGSLKIPGQLDHPDVIAAGKWVVDACSKAKKTCGTQVIDPDQKSVAKALKSGFNFIVLASDVFLMWKWAERMKKVIQSN